MKLKAFKAHKIVRSFPPSKAPYQAYRPDLERDFCERCAYCNLHKASITTPFEIDHFIPRKIFEGVRDDLENDYKNLVLACKKCNIAKGAKFTGNIKASVVENERFYDPTTVEYNTIFYRNEFGVIASDDLKGRRMITDIKLYRPIHTLGWLCEQLAETADKLAAAIGAEKDLSRRAILSEAKNNVLSQYFKFNRLFIAAYNNSDFSLPYEVE